MSAHCDQRLAVCSWSLQPVSPEDLIGKIRQTGINRIQLNLDPLREDPAVWDPTAAALHQAGIEIVSGMFGCVGEDYTTLDTIRVTGGIAPDGTWEQNRRNIQASARLASSLELNLVTFHAGFIPHDQSDPAFSKMLQRLGEAADIFAVEKLHLCLETGQETAPDLLTVLKLLNKTNVGVNFDPANMILYAKGNPIEALRTLGPWIRQVHIKDATSTKTPGTWGAEVPAGTGEVDWKAFFAALKALNFKGNFVIEREAGTERAADIRRAREVVEQNAA
jgi:sugar phosphate isomerase/epimerase